MNQVNTAKTDATLKIHEAEVITELEDLLAKVNALTLKNKPKDWEKNVGLFDEMAESFMELLDYHSDSEHYQRLDDAFEVACEKINPGGDITGEMYRYDPRARLGEVVL